jgi:uncharacterized protein (TIGR03437 family)
MRQLGETVESLFTKEWSRDGTQFYQSRHGSDQPRTGSLTARSPLSMTTTTPTVTIGGAQATVIFSGPAPGFPGWYQVNTLVPPGLSKGPAVPIVIAIVGATSNTVTIAAQ